MKKSLIVGVLALFMLLAAAGCELNVPTDPSTQKTQNALAVEQTKLAYLQSIASTSVSPTATLQPAGPTATQPPALTATATSQPTMVTPSPTTTYLAMPGFYNLIDDFTDPTSGWPEDTTSDFSTWYATDHYHIQVNVTSSQYAVRSGYTMTNGTVTTYGLILDQTSSPQAYLGVTCRMQDTQTSNYYFFEVSYDGSYRIGKFWDGVYSLIGMTAPKTSPAIKVADYNEIQATCFLNELSLTVNGTFIETVYDNTFTTGDTGLCASSDNVPGIIAAFGYFRAEED